MMCSMSSPPLSLPSESLRAFIRVVQDVQHSSHEGVVALYAWETLVTNHAYAYAQD